MVVRLIIFDLDQTLRGETLFPQSLEILEYLKQNEYYMSMASFNMSAKWLCDRYGITHYFDHICGVWNPFGKLYHIEIIRDYYSRYDIYFEDHEILFIDDMIEVLNIIKKNRKIHCLHVADPKKGVYKDDIITKIWDINTKVPI